jgi:hypothetical protein
MLTAYVAMPILYVPGAKPVTTAPTLVIPCVLVYKPVPTIVIDVGEEDEE